MSFECLYNLWEQHQICREAVVGFGFNAKLVGVMLTRDAKR